MDHIRRHDPSFDTAGEYRLRRYMVARWDATVAPPRQRYVDFLRAVQDIDQDSED